MNKKLLLPLTLGLCAALFTACGNDNGSSANTQLSSAANTQLSSAADPLPTSSATLATGAPATPTIGEDGFAQRWVRSDEGFSTMENNPAITVADFSDYTYYGAELSGRDQFTYGRFEARMKMVAISGSVSSMFLYYDDSYKADIFPWNEIDIEILGKNSGAWQSNLITRYPDGDDGKKNKNISSEEVHQFGFDATADFHLYAMIWTPEYISWEIDSVEVRRDYIGEKLGQVEFMTEQQSLRFNLWASKSPAWTGKFTGAELADGPKEQLIDYVRVYNYDPATKTFTLDWQDDFDGDDIDPDHWKTGNWEMENVMLTRDNIEVRDGYCVMMISRE